MEHKDLIEAAPLSSVAATDVTPTEGRTNKPPTRRRHRTPSHATHPAEPPEATAAPAPEAPAPSEPEVAAAPTPRAPRGRRGGNRRQNTTTAEPASESLAPEVITESPTATVPEAPISVAPVPVVENTETVVAEPPSPAAPTPAAEPKPEPQRRYRFDRPTAVITPPPAPEPVAPRRLGPFSTLFNSRPAPVEEPVVEAPPAPVAPHPAFVAEPEPAFVAPIPEPVFDLAEAVVDELLELEELSTPETQEQEPESEEASPSGAELPSRRRRRRRRGGNNATASASTVANGHHITTLESLVQTPAVTPPPVAASAPPPPLTKAPPTPPTPEIPPDFLTGPGYAATDYPGTLDHQSPAAPAAAPSPYGSPEPAYARGFGPTPRGVATEYRTPAPRLRPERDTGAPISPNHLATVITSAIQQQTDRLMAETRRYGNTSMFTIAMPSTERLGVFVDVANLWYSSRSMRIPIDFGKLLTYLRGDRRLIRAHAYCPTSPEQYAEQQFLAAVKGLGYRITTKDYKTFSSGAKKADMDLDLCMDIVRIVDSQAVDTIVLVSGDSDFLPLLEYCSDKGVRVEVAAFDESTAAILRQSCDLFINLSVVEEIRA